MRQILTVDHENRERAGRWAARGRPGGRGGQPVTRGQVTLVRSGTTWSAPARSSGGWVVATPTQYIPAAFAAATPAGASSNTTHAAGAVPSLRAAARSPSGSGLPTVTSPAVTTTENSSCTPSSSRVCSAYGRPADVTR